jgi:predicted nucleic acid-binding protein
VAAGTEALTPTLAEVVPPGARLLIDSSVVLAYLAGSEAASATATRIFDEFLATGRDRGALSMVSVGEILVRPFRAGPAALAIAEGFLGHFADLDLIEIDYAIAREAARIRATTDMRMPDALILSTALVAGIDLFCTNDRGQAVAADRLGIETRVLIDIRAG